MTRIRVRGMRPSNACFFNTVKTVLSTKSALIFSLYLHNSICAFINWGTFSFTGLKTYFFSFHFFFCIYIFFLIVNGQNESQGALKLVILSSNKLACPMTKGRTNNLS